MGLPGWRTAVWEQTCHIGCETMPSSHCSLPSTAALEGGQALYLAVPLPVPRPSGVALLATSTSNGCTVLWPGGVCGQRRRAAALELEGRRQTDSRGALGGAAKKKKAIQGNAGQDKAGSGVRAWRQMTRTWSDSDMDRLCHWQHRSRNLVSRARQGSWSLAT